MARKVFFSFHYSDILLVSQIRNSWRLRPGSETQPFHDRAEWERVKRQSPTTIQNWIDTQLKGSSITVVLVGSATASRPWVKYEIESSIAQKKGIIFINLDGMKTTQGFYYRSGSSPANWTLNRTGQRLSMYYKSYNWVRDSGYQNMGQWVEEAYNAPKP
jgi:MTH538 TIR-like domain (DUF1863)